MKNLERKGFTLIELLIVMTVIGILSAMMMLSGSEVVSSAEAAKIINNMVNLKKAVVSWYTDNYHEIAPNRKGEYMINGINGVTSLSDFLEQNPKEILKYLSNYDTIKFKSKRYAQGSNNKREEDYYIFLDVEYKTWYIYYNTGSDVKLKDKLASKASSIGLFGLNDVNREQDLVSNKAKQKFYSGEKFVCLVVFALA